MGKRRKDGFVRELMRDATSGWAGIGMTLGIAAWWLNCMAYLILGGRAAPVEGTAFTLDMHGKATEVTHAVWLVMRILEPAGLAGLALACLSFAAGAFHAANGIGNQREAREHGVLFATVFVSGFALTMVAFVLAGFSFG